ncbi:MAG: Zn-ribbon domain-containing OB-fold protein [Actinobacteria bacterium]|nr:Zn-ribbon domain-containing OB-fold protein [Actinomycetota bacterium]
MEIRPFNDTSYKQFLGEGLLMASQCKKCGTLSFPPRQICANCYGSESEWVELAGSGRLAAYTSVYVAPPDMVAQGYNREHPYVVGVVDLDEGVRAVARIVGVDAKNPETIEIGTSMRVHFPEICEGVERHCLFFAPAED